MSLYNLFKHVAFRIDPESMHNFSMRMFAKLPGVLCKSFGAGVAADEKMQLKVASLTWDFPVGLAAGLDKNGEAIEFFARLGFGAVEVGTVTPKAQPGNEKPRLFRYPKENSLRNCMGFNNAGAQEIFDNIGESDKVGKLLGVNLGKNKITPQDKAGDDYRVLYKKFAPVADYLVVNVSSPNTPGLRDLQQKEGMESILKELVEVRKECDKPLYIKVSPDATHEDLESIIALASQYKLEGLIATNTTIMEERGGGGVSGKLLQSKARDIRNFILSKLPDDLELIGVGGVESIDDLVDFWKHGGKVMQIYSSFIFQGPEILQKMNTDILSLMNDRQCQTLQELISSYQK